MSSRLTGRHLEPAKKVRVAVVGAGDFGRNHARVYRELEDAELIGIVDANPARAAQVAEEFSTEVLPDIESLAGPRGRRERGRAHRRARSRRLPLLELGIDVLVEKPMAASLAEADALLSAASRAGRILQVGHLERFNPGIVAVMPALNRPLYFEVHRLGVFTPRSLDIDVVYDVMIHDLDILLALVDAPVMDIKAIGIPVLTDKVDIAHARLDFASGAVANVTASRVSTERVRKLRFFQQHEYISVDFTRQDALRVRVVEPGPQPKFDFTTLPVGEGGTAPRRIAVIPRFGAHAPRSDGGWRRRAPRLELADQVMAGILEHGRRVQLGAFATPQANR